MFLRCGQSNNLGLKMEQILNKYTSTSNDRRIGGKTFKKKKIINMIYDLYIYQKKLLINNPDYSNNFFIPGTIFDVIMRYFQDKELNNVISILKTTFNTQLITSIIGSFKFLNETDTI